MHCTRQRARLARSSTCFIRHKQGSPRSWWVCWTGAIVLCDGVTGPSFFLCVVQEEKENILKILEHHKITYTPTPKTIPLKVRRVGACGTCPFEARLFILELTSVVCHILCSWCTRDSITKWCHNEALDAKIHTIRADNTSQTKRNIIALRTAELVKSVPKVCLGFREDISHQNYLGPALCCGPSNSLKEIKWMFQCLSRPIQ